MSKGLGRPKRGFFARAIDRLLGRRARVEAESSDTNERQAARNLDPKAGEQRGGKAAPLPQAITIEPTTPSKTKPKEPPFAQRGDDPRTATRLDSAILASQMGVRSPNSDAAYAYVNAGTSTQFGGSRQGAVIDLVLGVDFGTSATKIIVRAPYVAAVPPHTVSVPQESCAENNPYLWQSNIWVQEDGTFSMTPAPNTKLLENIKARLMGDEPQQPLALLSDGCSVSAADAAVAYLAFVYRYTRGWFLATKQAAYRRSPLVWQTNVGLPAATYNDPQLVEIYRRVVAAAWLLSQQDAPIALTSVQRAFDDPRPTKAAREQAARDELGIEVIPEVAAEVVGFARSTSRREGLYTLVDVGAGTLDVCTFRLHSWTPGVDRYSMYTADVQLLGVEPLARRIREGGSSEECAAAIDQMLHQVIWQTKIRRDPVAEEWRKELPIFFCGGGRASEDHKAAVSRLSSWLARSTGRDPRVSAAPVFTLDVPENFDAEASVEFHRFAVAWGLSYPRFDIGDLDCPSDISDMAPMPVRRSEETFVSKDHV